jgi:NACHT domain
MSTSLVAPLAGQSYQARLFWMYAIRLLQPTSELQSVGFEDDSLKSFDDLVLHYGQPQRWQDRLIDRDFIQIKYHGDATGSIGYQQLIDPAFIGAESHSFLQKAKAAFYKQGGEPSCRLTLCQSWGISTTDPLARVFDNRTGGLRLERLFDGTGDRSQMGQIRKAWREHLNVDDDELRRMLIVVRLHLEHRTLESLREDLNQALIYVGLVPISGGDVVFLYDHLIWNYYLERGGASVIFDRETLIDLLESQELFSSSSKPSIVQVSVQKKWTFNPKEHTARVLERYKVWFDLYAPLWTVQQQFSLFVQTKDGQRIGIFDLERAVSSYILLGESGSGKTVTLWALAVHAAQAISSGNLNTRVPVVLNLSELRSGMTLLDLLASTLDTNATLEDARQVLEATPIMLLIDGLNELAIDPDTHSNVLNEMSDLAHNPGHHHLVMTCRTADFHPEWLESANQPSTKKPPVAAYQLERLQQDQVREIIQRHFKDEPKREQELLALLKIDDLDFWSKHSEAINLARIPMHLQLLIAEYVNHGSVSTNRATLIRGFVHAMAKAIITPHFPNLTDTAVLSAVRRIAFETTRHGCGLIFPRIIATQTLRITHSEYSPDRLVRLLESNNFLRVRHATSLSGSSTPERLEWLHQLIRDYALALEMVDIFVFAPVHAIRGLFENMLKTYPAVFSQASELAMEMLELDDCVRLTIALLAIDAPLLETAIDILPIETADEIVGAVFKVLFSEDSWTKDTVCRLALVSPSLKAIQVIRTYGKLFSQDQKEQMAAVLAEVAITFQNYKPVWKEVMYIAQVWIAYKSSDIVRFYAAKAFWGKDRGQAGAVLGELLRNKKSSAHLLAQTLVREWNMLSFD